jgi:hypothetical protein
MEGFAVSSKHHIRLEPLTLMGINPRRLDAHQPREVQAEGMALKLLPEPLDKMPSMAQDIKNGRLTEIDYINGILVEWGKKLAVPTPVNEEIVKTVHAIEEKQKTQSPALLDAMIEKLGLRRDGK